MKSNDNGDNGDDERRPDEAPGGEGVQRIAEAGRRFERTRTALLVLTQVVLVGILFVQVNYLSCRRHSTVDLTRNQRFTLSDTTENYLRNLGGEVRIVMAFLGTSDLYLEVKGLVSEFDRVGGDAVTAEYLDLSRSRSRLAELEDTHGLNFGGNQVVILGESGRLKVIAAEELVRRDPNTGRVAAFLGEEVIASALLEVTEMRQRKVYLVSGGRRADELVPIARQLQPLATAQNARLEGLVLEGRPNIPEDADALFFPGNETDLTEREIDLVRGFWEERQGGLVFFLDPAADTPNLNTLFREHGVAPNPDRVLSRINIPGVATRRSYEVPVVLMPGAGPTRDLPALSLRLGGQTQSLDVLYDDDLLRSENIFPQPLMIAGEGFWGETEYEAEEVSYNPDVDAGPPDLVYTAASVEKGIPGDAGFSEGSSRLVVVGNPDLISPDGNTPKVAADFTMAALNWVMDREELMGISPRQPTAYTLAISPGDLGWYQTIVIFLLPGAALLVGGLVWLKRRA